MNKIMKMNRSTVIWLVVLLFSFSAAGVAALHVNGAIPWRLMTASLRPTIDDTPPKVEITSPSNGDTVRGTITIVATASDVGIGRLDPGGVETENADGVAGVQFKLDDQNLGAEDTTFPYEISWDTTAIRNGYYALTAVARDEAGNLGTSGPVRVRVYNGPHDDTPPTAVITSPRNGDTVSDTIPVSADASDVGIVNLGPQFREGESKNIDSIAGVQFMLDGENLGEEDTTSPYDISWNTRIIPNGRHTLTAVARDEAGNLGTSGPVVVTVDNTTSGDPITITSPRAGATYNGTFLVSVAVNNNDNNIRGVQFTLNGENLGEMDTSPPYEVSLNTNNPRLMDGIHNLWAWARLTDNNWVGAPSARDFLVDNNRSTDGILVQKNDLEYLGSFRLPAGYIGGDADRDTFAYGGQTLAAYEDPNTRKQTLFVRGHASGKSNVAQVEVPAESDFVKSNNWDALPEARVLQRFYDVADGRLGEVSGEGENTPVYGLLEHNGRLIAASSLYYGSEQYASHGAGGLNLADSRDFTGFFPVSASAPLRALGGPMGNIPPEFQALFGGPVVTFQCCLSAVGSSSTGPGVTVIDPDKIGVENPVPGETLLFYNLNHPGRDLFASNNLLGTLASYFYAVAFVPGTNSLLFAGLLGSSYCYENSALGDDCNDPCGEWTGVHGYPYRHGMWAFRASDLLMVKDGLIESWEPRPYAAWTFDDLDTNGCAGMSGAGYDPKTNRIYIAQDYGESPRLDVFQIHPPNN